MATVTKYLWARTGSLSLPGKTVSFWGFASSFLSDPQMPGPLIEATEGDILVIRLLNSFLNDRSIGEPVSIIFPGQENVSVRSWPFGEPRAVQPQYSEGKIVSLTDYMDITDYYSLEGLEYQFTATRPGIFLYESGTTPEKQVQMGMYGVLLIRPRGFNIPGHPNYMTAYGEGTRSDYDVEKVLVLGEVDSVMHQNVSPGIYYDMLQFKPDFWVINGRCFPDTLKADDTSSQPYTSLVNCRAGQRILLRVVNAGFHQHTFYLGGLIGRVVAEDGFPLVSPGKDLSYEKAGITLGSGQSVDIILSPTIPGEYYLYDREYNHLLNNDQFPGGMMTRLDVSA